MSELARHAAVDSESSKGMGALTIGSVGAVLASVTGSLTAYGSLPGEVQLHWVPGVEAGPAGAPAVLVLALFPALVTGVALAGESLAARLRARGEFEGMRTLHTTAVLGTLAVLLCAQQVIILANL